MSKRYFTADFHFGMADIIKYEQRPYQNIIEMNNNIIDMCNSIAQTNDIIIHAGDLACYNSDRGNAGLKINPQQYIDKINSTFINIHGNHDLTNKVKSVCESMRTILGKKYLDVSISHYPSFDTHSAGHWLTGDIHLCGHVHRKWKHCLDLNNRILNINVGIDVWNYKIVSEDDLILYIDKLLKMDRSKINKVIKDNSGRYVKV